MLPATGGGADASCSASGCALGGTIVIDNTSGAIISEDVTFTGESPIVGPFTQNLEVGTSTFTQLDIGDANGGLLNLDVETTNFGSLVGYTGGPLAADTIVTASPSELTCGSDCSSTWIIPTSPVGIPGKGNVLGVGSLTKAPAAVAESDHELAPVLLIASGLAAAFRKRMLPN